MPPFEPKITKVHVEVPKVITPKGLSLPKSLSHALEGPSARPEGSPAPMRVEPRIEAEPPWVASKAEIFSLGKNPQEGLKDLTQTQVDINPAAQFAATLIEAVEPILDFFGIEVADIIYGPEDYGRLGVEVVSEGSISPNAEDLLGQWSSDPRITDREGVVYSIRTPSWIDGINAMNVPAGEKIARLEGPRAVRKFFSAQHRREMVRVTFNTETSEGLRNNQVTLVEGDTQVFIMTPEMALDLGILSEDRGFKYWVLSETNVRSEK